MIKIGVTSCFLYPDPERKFFGPKTLVYFENDMANFLAQKKVMPILIPDIHDKKILKNFLDQMDGFVFQGGSDLCPTSYKEPFLDQARWPGDPHRDQYELKIFDYAFKKSKPILAVCRGFQLMNVYFGGTLHQDLGSQTKSDILHRDAVLYDKIHHQVEMKDKGLLSKLYPKSKKVTVNSVHHQGVKKLGKDLLVEATADDDGLVEAATYKNLKKKFVVGVQWHPEFSHTLGAKVLNPRPLLEKFLKECRK